LDVVEREISNQSLGLDGYATTASVQTMMAGIVSKLNVLESGQFDTLNVSGSVIVAGILTIAGSATFNSIKVQGRIITAGISPTAAVLGEGTVTASGNSTAGEVNFTNIGTSPGKQVKVTFVKPFSKKPRIKLTPISEAAASVRYFIEPSTT